MCLQLEPALVSPYHGRPVEIVAVPENNALLFSKPCSSFLLGPVCSTEARDFSGWPPTGCPHRGRPALRFPQEPADVKLSYGSITNQTYVKSPFGLLHQGGYLVFASGQAPKGSKPNIQGPGAVSSPCAARWVSATGMCIHGEARQLGSPTLLDAI
ncbi:hypothetical protein S40288_11140 [Stachybotrys chartarum IBT 40288]|nr:hypothetical protein S40288_11140 [Stachybotrys chartarum IBT 40288]